MLRKIFSLLAALGLVLAVGACSQSDNDNNASTEPSAKPDSSPVVHIVASTNNWADVAKAVVGKNDNVDVESFIADNSVDPHEFEPSASDMAKLSKATLVVGNGGGYDNWLSSKVDPVTPMILALPESEHAHGHDHGHDHGEEGHDHEHGHDHGEEGHDHEHDHAAEEGHEGHDHAEGTDEHDHATEEGHEGHDHAEGTDEHDHRAEEGHEGHDHAEGTDEHDHAAEEGHEGHDHDSDKSNVIVAAADQQIEEYGLVNPHVWFDPAAVEAVAKAIDKEVKRQLEAADRDTKGISSEKVENKLAKLNDRLTSLPDHKTAQTEPIASYLIKPSKLKDITPKGYMEAALKESEPAAKDIAEYEALIKDKKIDFIIVNPQADGPVGERLAKTAKDAGIPVAELTETPEPKENFFDFLDRSVNQLEKVADNA